VTTRLTWFDHSIACAIWQWCVSWKLYITGHIVTWRLNARSVQSEKHSRDIHC
jgi:hypothetical protein